MSRKTTHHRRFYQQPCAWPAGILRPAQTVRGESAFPRPAFPRGRHSVSDLVAPYARRCKIIADYLAGKSEADAHKFFWKNPLAAYPWVPRAKACSVVPKCSLQARAPLQGAEITVLPRNWLRRIRLMQRRLSRSGFPRAQFRALAEDALCQASPLDSRPSSSGRQPTSTFTGPFTKGIMFLYSHGNPAPALSNPRKPIQNCLVEVSAAAIIGACPRGRSSLSFASGLVARPWDVKSEQVGEFCACPSACRQRCWRWGKAPPPGS